jgi:hypothetical protein
MSGVKFKRLSVSAWKSALQTVAVLLLTSGASQINNGDYLTGGLLSTVGFILFIIANYAWEG